MSKPLVVVIPHRLGKEEALRRLQPGLSRAAAAFPVLKVEQEEWTGDSLDFRVRALGQTAFGTIDVRENDLRLEVTLPWVLAKFAHTIEQIARSKGQLMIEKKS